MVKTFFYYLNNRGKRVWGCFSSFLALKNHRIHYHLSQDSKTEEETNFFADFRVTVKIFLRSCDKLISNIKM